MGTTLRHQPTGDVKLKLTLPNGQIRNFQLISVPRVTKAGMKVTFMESNCVITDWSEQVVASASKKGSLCYLNCTSAQNSSLAYIAKGKETDTWHRRYGHLGTTYLQQLSKNKLVTGFNYEFPQHSNVCEACVQGKNHKSAFPSTQRTKASHALELVHSDVCGKLRNKSLGGAEYFLVFIDDKTHFTWIYVLKKKSEVFQKFKEWKALVEKESGYMVKKLRTDNGGEYTSIDLEDFLLTAGIRHELTIPKTPEQNGVAERMNRTLAD
jgi:hypothetical protein